MTHPCSSRPLAKSVVLLVLAALAVTVSGAGADINLVLNPGFESPWSPYNRPVSSTYPLDNWSWGTDTELIAVDFWAHHGGAQSLGLNCNSPGWISQNLATVAGGTYDLSFFMSGVFLEDAGYDPTRMLGMLEVIWGGTSLGTVTFAKPSDWSTTNMGWTLKSGGILSGLAASGPSTELKFVSLDPGQWWQGSAVDDISVTLVPEPGSLSLLLLGLPGLVWLRRRQRA